MNALSALASHLRDPVNQSAPSGLPAAGLALYDRLVHNVLDQTLRAAFPALASLVTPLQWQTWLFAFRREHTCRTPIAGEIGDEWLEWFTQQGDAHAWALELAHYERVLSHLDRSDACLPAAGWSPLAWPLAYAWPVHTLQPGHIPATAPLAPTLLLAWRDARHQVRIETLAPAAWALAYALSEGQSLPDAISALPAPRDAGSSAGVDRECQALLAHWGTRDIWYG